MVEKLLKKQNMTKYRLAVEAGIPIYTSLDTAKALIDSLEKRKQGVPSLIDITKLR